MWLPNLAKFLANSYPFKLIQAKIKDFKNKTKKNKRDWDAERASYPERNFTLSLSFSHQFCEHIGKSIQKLFRKFTPDYNVHVTWKSINLDSIILPRLKAKRDNFKTNNCVYEFTCPACKNNYIGRTCRNLDTRISEHRQPSRCTNIYQHISECSEYKIMLNLLPNLADKRIFFKKQFKILERNLRTKTDRQVAESIHISIRKPTLNDQIDFVNHSAF